MCIRDRSLPGWIWWQAEKPPRRHSTLKDIIEEETKFDKDTVLPLVPERHQIKDSPVCSANCSSVRCLSTTRRSLSRSGIDSFVSVSYTHLDVYKRQVLWCCIKVGAESEKEYMKLAEKRGKEQQCDK